MAMFGPIGPVALAKLRRQIYPLLLLVGFTGVIAWMLFDLQTTTMAPSPITATSTLETVLKPLTGGTALDGFGHWSPDGKQIAFMRSGQIWLLVLQGKEPRALTSHAAVWDAVPTWRPDGRQIAFVRIDMSGEKAFIMLIDPVTGQTSALVKESQPIGYISWAPDGSGLFYTTPAHLMHYDLATKKRTVVTTAPDQHEMLSGGLAVSPDGTAVIFGLGPVTAKGVHYDLWQLLLKGKAAPVRLTEAGGIMPTFARSATRILYRSPRSATGIHLMELTTHGVTAILGDEPKAMFFHPQLSPDGSTLLVSRLVIEQGANPLTSHLYLHTLKRSGGN